jgi:glycoprotein endo-alpha-1,2-mannosidase
VPATVFRRLGALAAGAAVLGASLGFGSAPVAAHTASLLPHPLVGAYYYLWNPENMATGTLRAHLDPPQQPPPGLVDSQNPKTAARDIATAHQAGVNFFAIDWWPHDPGYSGADYQHADAAMKDFLAAPDLPEMKFAMFYETWNLGFNPPYEATPVTFQMALHFDSDMLYFAKHYFANKSYLRIDGRPVVYLYLTRTLTGNVAALMQGARKVLKEHGYNPFFIGDEVYWRVTPEAQSPQGPVLTTTPQVQRIEQFDAVTSYILYYGDSEQMFGPASNSTGYPGLTTIAADQRFLLTVYRNATQNQVPVIPDVTPGFNDRGFRLSTNHPVQPRQWLPGDGPASTLDHFFKCVAIPEVDPSLPIVMLTSWDDWNEDTGIEPIPGTPTRSDDSPSGTAYTQGYEYGDVGRSDVTALRRDVGLLDQSLSPGGLTARQKAMMARDCATSPG